jgi:hypothetical protein
LGDIVEKNLRGGACSTYWGEKRFLWGTPEKNIPLGRPRHRWEGNIKMNL